MSNPLSQASKVVKKVFKPVAKGFKKIAKPLAIAAAIYFTGGALGAWALPGAGAASAASAGVVGANTVLAPSAGAVGANTVLAPAAANIGGGIVSGAMQGVTNMAGAGAGAAGGVWGGVKEAARTMLDFTNKYPTATYLAGSTLQSMFTPTAAEQQMELEDYRRNNSSYFGVSGAGGGSGSDLSRLSEVVRPMQSQTNPRRALSQYTGQLI